MVPSDTIPINGNESSANPSESISLKTIVLSKNNRRGFTLVELILVCALIGVLILIASSGYTNFKDDARIARASEEIRGIEKDISAYAIDKGNYPASLSDIPGSDHLDPWGRPYEYKIYDTGNMRHLGAIELNTDFDLYSKGKDGVSVLSIGILDTDSADDILRANDGSFVGAVRHY